MNRLPICCLMEPFLGFRFWHFALELVDVSFSCLDRQAGFCSVNVQNRREVFCWAVPFVPWVVLVSKRYFMSLCSQALSQFSFASSALTAKREHWAQSDTAKRCAVPDVFTHI
ncbi:hypothetical protein ABUK73_06585 [Agrobacterium sp. BA1120]|uniref:hypothetical protein n=1 Tax=Agrobacterium sp. BA1120 TaxID=3228927 RepID=UPI003369E39F